jgi:hypothetical protein
LPAPRPAAHSEARNLILAGAIVIGRATPDRWTSYSRRKVFYVGWSRYLPPCLTYATVVPCIDELAAHGLIEHDKGFPGR